MPSVLILCDHRPGRSPSQRYRFEQYLKFLESKGYHFTWSYLLNKKDDDIFYSAGNTFSKVFILMKSLVMRSRDASRFKNFDIIFIQREANFLGTSRYEKKAFQSGAKVIFDFDDSIWMADTSPGNQKWQWIKRPAKFYSNVKYASVVIAGNDYLAAEAKKINPNTIVIPTTIDTSLHQPLTHLRNKKTLTIGWSGSISTVKHFQLIEPVLFKIKTKYGSRVRFKLIGDESYKNAALNLEPIGWSENTEVEDLNSFDIGIMPLPDDEWSKGKCGLKGLSYMACGVATIMSAVGVNTRIIKHGQNGFLAENDYEWFSLLCGLIESKAQREAIGRASRQTVVENYSVEANKNNYLQAFSRRSS